MAQILEDYLLYNMSLPWDMGTKTDCCMLAGDWVWLATGRDPMVQFRGKYRDESSAARLLIRRAGGSLPEAFRQGCAEAGLAEVPPETALRGDVGTVEAPWKEGVVGLVGAICAGDDFWYVRAEHGLRCDVYPASAAWRVPWRQS